MKTPLEFSRITLGSVRNVNFPKIEDILWGAVQKKKQKLGVGWKCVGKIGYTKTTQVNEAPNFLLQFINLAA